MFIFQNFLPTLSLIKSTISLTMKTIMKAWARLTQRPFWEKNVCPTYQQIRRTLDENVINV